MTQNTGSEQRKWRSFLGTVILLSLVSIVAASIVSPPDPFTMAIVSGLFVGIAVVASFGITYVVEFNVLPSSDSPKGWAVLESDIDGSEVTVTHDLITGGMALIVDGEEAESTSKFGALMLAYIIIAFVGGLVIGAGHGF